VGEGQHSFSSLSERLVDVFHVLSEFLSHGLNAALVIDLVAHVHDSFRSTFQEEIVGFVISTLLFVDGTHPFVRGIERDSAHSLAGGSVLFDGSEGLDELDDGGFGGVSLGSSDHGVFFV